jgi:Leucine-rich repeat (LRR) protein
MSRFCCIEKCADLPNSKDDFSSNYKFRLLLWRWILFSIFVTVMIFGLNAWAKEFDCSKVVEIPKIECESLVKFYNSTGGANWKNNTNWLGTTTPSNWYGVMIEHGHVSIINLYSNNLSGAIPDLDLPKLRTLNINSNQLTGEIPYFNNLPDLIGLHIHSNQLSGTIPDFSYLPNLAGLHLNDNQLNGNIPNFNLPNLASLHLHNNHLSGELPDLNLPSLVELVLSGNRLSGSIPNFNLPNLTWLDLSNNQFSGMIPDFDLPKLGWLTVYSNQLSGTIPNFNLPELREMHLGSNQLSGNLPNFDLPKLTTIAVSDNQLEGKIPNFNLPNLTWLHLSSNRFIGEIPDFNLPKLTGLQLENNQLSGEIPNFNLSNLETINLSNNQLSGKIPNFNFPNLTELDLSYNWLSGRIPDFKLLGNQESESVNDFSNLFDLAWLHLGYNCGLTVLDDSHVRVLDEKNPDWWRERGNCDISEHGTELNLSVEEPALVAPSSGHGGNIDCPDGSQRLTKFEWSGNSYVLEGSNLGGIILRGQTIDQTANAEGGQWTSTVPLTYLILKGATDNYTYELYGAQSGSFTKDVLTGVGSVGSPDISNMQFCGAPDALKSFDDLSVEGIEVVSSAVVWNLLDGSLVCDNTCNPTLLGWFAEYGSQEVSETAELMIELEVSDVQGLPIRYEYWYLDLAR